MLSKALKSNGNSFGLGTADKQVARTFPLIIQMVTAGYVAPGQ